MVAIPANDLKWTCESVYMVDFVEFYANHTPFLQYLVGMSIVCCSVALFVVARDHFVEGF